MCGIVGFCNLKQDISHSKDTLIHMNQTLAKRGPDEDGYFLESHIALGHKRLIVIDPEGGKQPMTYTYHENTYTIVYNGQIYNTEELKKELMEAGFEINSHSDTEILLKSFIHYGYDVVEKLNGIYAFAIWNEKKQELFLARDHFGVKPLFYTMLGDTFLFASEIKALLAYPGVEAKINKQGVCELFGLGPAHTPGTCVFQNILEIKPLIMECLINMDFIWKDTGN